MLITFEGVDGSGKTTTASLVAGRLTSAGVPTRLMAKRTPLLQDEFARVQLTALARQIWGRPKNAPLVDLGPDYWLHLNAAYFAGLHRALTTELGSAGVAVYDNWIHKFVARIATGDDLPLDRALTVLDALPRPDRVFLLDVPPAVAAARKPVITLAERGGLQPGDWTFESFQSAVRSNLLRMADHLGWTVIVPGQRTPDEIADEVAADVMSMVSQRLTISNS
ncbi:dTMP kinase [Kribbella catacumbae]|uniref:dTMP kinase n=1 Tax=Kribbella catacumbae TaxID=460086 RepID=UPI000378C289|nr:hypothetical protein [Kribbella catacumbae]